MHILRGITLDAPREAVVGREGQRWESLTLTWNAITCSGDNRLMRCRKEIQPNRYKMDYTRGVKDAETSKMASGGSAWALRRVELHLTDVGEPGSRAGLAESRVRSVTLMDEQAEVLTTPGRICEMWNWECKTRHAKCQ